MLPYCNPVRSPLSLNIMSDISALMTAAGNASASILGFVSSNSSVVAGVDPAMVPVGDPAPDIDVSVLSV